MNATRYIDVFHGDADGLCSLRQLRLVTPVDSILITGAKRQTALLGTASAGLGDQVTVLDLPLDSNQDALLGLLQRGACVRYYDHHASGGVPKHPSLSAIIDASPEVCTGVLVDRQLQGRYRIWAIVAAYGDNLGETAQRLGDSLGLNESQLAQLRILGEFLNYNSYGESQGDLIVHPCDLYRLLCKYDAPQDMLGQEPLIKLIAQTRSHDLERAWQVSFLPLHHQGSINVLPNAPWSRRVRGTFANELSNRWPRDAHAVLVEDDGEAYMVSVRAPRVDLTGADTLCRQFPTGGGRPAAAGINRLPRERMKEFAVRFREQWREPAKDVAS